VLNKPSDGTDGEVAISIKRPDCTPEEILEAINLADRQPDTNGNSNRLGAAWFESALQFPRIRLPQDDRAATLIKSKLDSLVRDVNGSLTRLNAVAVRAGSRTEQHFWFGVKVTSSHVTQALSPKHLGGNQWPCPTRSA
jgi:hypothetical protein